MPERHSSLPSASELALPAHWKSVDLLSDVHLCAAMPLTADRLERHLASTPADAVLFLGDLFEAWVGDDMLCLPFERRCAQMLLEASRRVQLGFMPGNRDFLVGSAMREACGWMPLQDPTLLDAWGQRFVLSHGDALCLDDHRYQAFRASSRTPQWQAGFMAASLVERMRSVAEVRASTRARRASESFDAAAWADVDEACAAALLERYDALALVHGHTHRPGRHALAGGRQRWVLSDWDLDEAHPPRADVLRISRDGIERLDLGSRA